MAFTMAELPLALFTTLSPVGVGAFVALALAFCTHAFTPEQAKKIDRFTVIPLLLVAVGFICSFFHLAAPMNVMGVFAGVGSSPLSNEIVAGCIFTVVAIVYWIVAMTGKLAGGARKGFVAVVAILAIVFAVFTGLAYGIRTIPTWGTPFVPVQVLGLALAGGSAVAALVLALAGAAKDAGKGIFCLAAVGVILAVIGVAGQAMTAGGLINATASGAAQAAGALIPGAAGVVLIVVAALLCLPALKKGSAAMGGLAAVLGLVGVFCCRLAFYAMQLSVGIYFN